MPTLSSRLAEYGQILGLRAPDLTSIVAGSEKEFKEKTAYAYVNGTRTPTYDGLVVISRSTGATLDWLAGEADNPMWNAQVRAACDGLKAWAATTDTADLDVYERCQMMLQQLHARLELAKQPWFLPSIMNLGAINGGEAAGLKKNMDLYEAWLEAPSRNTFSWVVKRLASFTGIPVTWIQLGDEAAMAASFSEESHDWATFRDLLQRRGVRADLAIKHVDAIASLVTTLEAVSNA